MQDVIASHGLSPNDGNAVASWGRSDAQGQLWLLIVKAIQTAPDQRTTPPIPLVIISTPFGKIWTDCG